MGDVRYRIRSRKTLEKLKAADADIRFEGKEVMTERLPVNNMSTHLIVKAGVLTLSPLNFGVAGGNGLELVARAMVRRVVALDFNPDYLALCTRRHATSFDQFEPVLHDLSQGPPAIAPVECIFAGLVLEYLCVELFSGYLASLLTTGGSFAALLQLPSATVPEISASPFASLTRLEPTFSFVHPTSLDDALSARGFSRITSERYDLDSGKSFYYASYQVTNTASL